MEKRIVNVKDCSSYNLLIEANQLERRYWKDIWRYRELLYFLALRDISVRYKQTFIGVAWVILRPLITMIVFTVVFGKIAGLPPGSSPYPLTVFCAMLAWQLFASILIDAGNSIISNSGMVSKIYFPRLLMPLTSVIVGIIDFLVIAGMLTALMAWYGIGISWPILILPVFMVILIALSLGAGLWIAALNVRYRDFRFLAAFLVQLSLYISPVGYTSDLIKPEWRLAYSLNPLVGIIDGFRWALIRGQSLPYLPALVISACLAILLLVSGIVYFRKMEKTFADDI